MATEGTKSTPDFHDLYNKYYRSAYANFTLDIRRAKVLDDIYPLPENTRLIFTNSSSRGFTLLKNGKMLKIGRTYYNVKNLTKVNDKGVYSCNIYLRYRRIYY